MKVRIRWLECRRCGHKWVPKVEDVRSCPKCKSPFWDRAKEIKAGADTKEKK